MAEHQEVDWRITHHNSNSNAIIKDLNDHYNAETIDYIPSSP